VSTTSAFLLGPALLFCPADRPDRYAKAAERADAVILDLEDAVQSAGRPAARRALVAHRLDPERTIVRVNPSGSEDFGPDLAAVSEAGYRMVMLPKAPSRPGVHAVAAHDPRLSVIALCETAGGVAEAASIASAPNVVALMWGAEDLVASLGGTSSRHPGGAYRDVARFARSTVLIAAAAHGKAAIDTVHLDIADTTGLAEEAADAVASGFAATACIHPSQVETIRAAYRPTDRDRDWARRVLAAASERSGVFRFEGTMVDAPVLRHAEAVLRRDPGPDARSV
jgi:citrate lyase subunit beta/citryl-CoA lyase